MKFWNFVDKEKVIRGFMHKKKLRPESHKNY